MSAEQTVNTAISCTELQACVPSADVAAELADCRWIDRFCLPPDGAAGDLSPDRTLLSIDNPDSEPGDQSLFGAEALEFQAEDLNIALRCRAKHPRKQYYLSLASDSWEPLLLRLAPQLHSKAPGVRVSLASTDMESAVRLAERATSLGVPWRFVWQVRDRKPDLIGWCGFIGELARLSPPAALAVKTVPYRREALLKRVGFLRECLRHLDFRKGGIRLISCPCCARCKVDFQPIAHAVGEAIRNLDKDLDVAVMGCEINGPGEARTADVGVACGKGVGVIFRKGEIVRRVSPDLIVNALLEEIHAMD